MTGKGEYTWPNGAKYVGDFVDAYNDGEGIYEYADGSKYEG